MLDDLETPIGTFSFDTFLLSDTRIGIKDCRIEEDRGPNSTYSWPLDQEEALIAAAQDVGAEASLLVPGGFRITPGSAVAAVREALRFRCHAMKPTGRRLTRG